MSSIEPDQSSRFVFLKEDNLNDIIDESLSDNSKRKSKWAVNTFNSWLKARQNSGIINGLQVFKTLNDMSKGELNSQLEYFIFEVRKENGDRYPRNTLKDLFQGIGYHMSCIQKNNFKIFSDEEFFTARAALDAAMKKADRDGIFPQGNGSASPITPKEEENLWEENILGDKNPKQLLNYLLLYWFVFCSKRRPRTSRA